MLPRHLYHLGLSLVEKCIYCVWRCVCRSCKIPFEIWCLASLKSVCHVFSYIYQLFMETNSMVETQYGFFFFSRYIYIYILFRLIKRFILKLHLWWKLKMIGLFNLSLSFIESNVFITKFTIFLKEKNRITNCTNESKHIWHSPMFSTLSYLRTALPLFFISSKL